MDKETPKIEQDNNFIFYAPSVHTGGGLVLLQEALNTKDFANNWKDVYLDERIRTKLNLSSAIKNIIFVKSRLLAEWKLKQSCKISDTILCFHGLPPLLPVKGKVIIFIQNRILLEPIQNNNYSIFSKLNILIKKLWLRFGSKTNIRYIVQTPSMAKSAKEFLGKNIDITILPFAPQNLTTQNKNSNYTRKFDFIYPASGEPHKNHRNLLKAWQLLADMDVKPSLALTINPKIYPWLAQELQEYIQEYQLDIVNLGELPAKDVLGLYPQVSALIFPSSSESFGLPLIEATEYKVPILASELDYVRDVSNPVETFDPNSPLSIARAVRRFLNNDESLIAINSAEEFLKKVILVDSYR